MTLRILLIVICMTLLFTIEDSMAITPSDSGKTRETIYEYVNGSWKLRFSLRYEYGNYYRRVFFDSIPVNTGSVPDPNLQIYDYQGNLLRSLYAVSYPTGSGYGRPVFMFGGDSLLIVREDNYQFKNSLMILSSSLSYGGAGLGGWNNPMRSTVECTYNSFDSLERSTFRVYRDGYGEYGTYGKTTGGATIKYNSKNKRALIVSNNDGRIDSIVYSYNASDMIQEEYRNSNNITVSKKLYEYSSSNKILSEISTVKKKNDSLFIPSAKTLNIYNQKDLLSQIDYLKWNDTIKIWKSAGVTKYLYDSEDKLTEIIYLRYSNIIAVKGIEEVLSDELTPVSKTIISYTQLPSSIKNSSSNGFELSCNPNPLKENSTISYAFPHDGLLKITLHDIFGREIAVIHNAFKNAGSHTIPLKNADLPNGMYFLKMSANGQNITKSISISR